MISENITTIVLNYAVELWTGKWRCAVRWQLKDGPKRFSEIKKKLPGCSVKVLTSVLKEMEEKKLVIRKQYNNRIPVKVTYELADTAFPIIENLKSYINITANHLIAHQKELNISDETIYRIKHELNPEIYPPCGDLGNNMVSMS